MRDPSEFPVTDEYAPNDPPDAEVPRVDPANTVVTASDAGPGWDGNVESTPVTNEMAKERGFPALDQDGNLVSIVGKRYDEGGGQIVLIADDGSEFVPDPMGGGTAIVARDVAEERAEADATRSEQPGDQAPAPPTPEEDAAKRRDAYEAATGENPDSSKATPGGQIGSPSEARVEDDETERESA